LADKHVKCPDCGESLKDYKSKVYAEPKLGNKTKRVYRCVNRKEHKVNQDLLWSVETHEVVDSFTAMRLFVVYDKKPN
jgi:hypothetical protein